MKFAGNFPFLFMCETYRLFPWLIHRVVHKIPVSKVIDPLLEIDRNPQKLEVFLTSCQPTLTIANIKTFLPCTINIDPYLRKLIRGTALWDFICNVQSVVTTLPGGSVIKYKIKLNKIYDK